MYADLRRRRTTCLEGSQLPLVEARSFVITILWLMPILSMHCTSVVEALHIRLGHILILTNRPICDCKNWTVSGCIMNGRPAVHAA